MFSRLGAQPDLSPVCRVQQPPQIQTGRQLDSRRNLGAWLVFRHLLLCLRKSLKDSRQRHVFASCLDFAVPRMRDARVENVARRLHGAAMSPSLDLFELVWTQVSRCRSRFFASHSRLDEKHVKHRIHSAMLMSRKWHFVFLRECILGILIYSYASWMILILNVSTSQLLQLISFSVSLVPDAQTRQTTGRWLHT